MALCKKGNSDDRLLPPIMQATVAADPESGSGDEHFRIVKRIGIRSGGLGTGSSSPMM